jgi:hypothetical protein
LLLLKLIQAKFLFEWIIEQKKKKQIGQRKFAMCTNTKNDRCATIGQRKKYRHTCKKAAIKDKLGVSTD